MDAVKALEIIYKFNANMTEAVQCLQELERIFPQWKASLRHEAMQIHELRSEVNNDLLTDLATAEEDVSGKLYHARRKRERREELLDQKKTERFQAEYRAGKRPAPIKGAAKPTSKGA